MKKRDNSIKIMPAKILCIHEKDIRSEWRAGIS
jgi:hypothetical protein